MTLSSNTTRRVGAVIALSLALAGIWWWAAPRLMHMAAQAIVASRSLKFRSPAPDFTLENASGKKVSLTDYKGQVVLLNFWATWCGPCQVEIPWFVEFEKKYQPKGFTVLGVSMDDDGWKVVRPFLTAKSVNYPVVLGDEKVNQLYGGIEALPTTLLLGRDGRIVFIHSGLVGRDEYQKEILELLAEKPAAGGQSGM
jgi:cytochrome c biogenesis protein CcmG/thiol:disulfide interchange protein DsbE